MGKKSRKRIIKRRSLPAVLLSRKSFRCFVCYPEKEYALSSEKMPIVATIYVGKKKVKVGNSERNLLIAWCAECHRWLAREEKWRVTYEDTDIAHELADGKAGKGEMSFTQFVCMCDDWRKYC